MKLKRIFLILAALVAFSSALTAASDYEQLLDKYKTLKKSLVVEKEEKRRLAEEAQILAEKKAEIIKNAEHIKSIDAYLVKIPNRNYSTMMTEVTQKQWQIIMGRNPSYFTGDSLPVECVSWFDAVEFCNALSEKQGLEKCYSNGRVAYYDQIKYKDVTEEDYNKDQKKKSSEQQVIKYYVINCNFNANGYRLPTVEEWKYAAKGGKSDYYHSVTYSGSDNLDEVGWYSKNSEGKTHPVAQKKPNGYGLYDMSGNVWEWCWDSCRSVCRDRYGGSWKNIADGCTVYNDEGWGRASGTYDDLGFRIVRSSSKK